MAREEDTPAATASAEEEAEVTTVEVALAEEVLLRTAELESDELVLGAVVAEQPAPETTVASAGPD